MIYVLDAYYTVYTHYLFVLSLLQFFELSTMYIYLITRHSLLCSGFVGTVVTGRVETGEIKTGEELEIVGLIPTTKTTCTGIEIACSTLLPSFFFTFVCVYMLCVCVCVCVCV